MSVSVNGCWRHDSCLHALLSHWSNVSFYYSFCHNQSKAWLILPSFSLLLIEQILLGFVWLFSGMNHIFVLFSMKDQMNHFAIRSIKSNCKYDSCPDFVNSHWSIWSFCDSVGQWNLEEWFSFSLSLKEPVLSVLLLSLAVGGISHVSCSRKNWTQIAILTR